MFEADEKYLNKRIIVTRKDGSQREVEIMIDESTGKYAYVNLTSHHVCPCRFDTIADAVNDMRTALMSSLKNLSLNDYENFISFSQTVLVRYDLF